MKEEEEEENCERVCIAWASEWASDCGRVNKITREYLNEI